MVKFQNALISHNVVNMLKTEPKASMYATPAHSREENANLMMIANLHSKMLLNASATSIRIKQKMMKLIL